MPEREILAAAGEIRDEAVSIRAQLKTLNTKLRRQKYVIAIVVVALLLGGYNVYARSRLTHCLRSWATAYQDRTSALTGPSQARTNALAEQATALADVTAILAEATTRPAGSPPDPDTRARYYAAIKTLSEKGSEFKAADKTYQDALAANPLAPVAAKLRC